MIFLYTEEETCHFVADMGGNIHKNAKYVVAGSSSPLSWPPVPFGSLFSFEDGELCFQVHHLKAGMPEPWGLTWPSGGGPSFLSSAKILGCCCCPSGCWLLVLCCDGGGDGAALLFMFAHGLKSLALLFGGEMLALTLSLAVG